MQSMLHLQLYVTWALKNKLNFQQQQSLFS